MSNFSFGSHDETSANEIHSDNSELCLTSQRRTILNAKSTSKQFSKILSYSLLDKNYSVIGRLYLGIIKYANDFVV